MDRPPIDWSRFDGDPECSCTCRCGETFRSHAKTVWRGGRFAAFTRKPCPGCGRDDDCRAIRTDPETWAIRG